MADYTSEYSGSEVDTAISNAHEHDNKEVIDRINVTPLIVISSANATIEQDATTGVSPYNTSYKYTNVTLNDLTEADLVEGTTIIFNIGSVSSTYRNVRVRFGSTGTWYPLFYTTGIASGYSYVTSSSYSIFVFSKQYRTTGAFHITDHNSTYAAYSFGIGCGTCTTAAETVAKVVTLSSYVLQEGGLVSVKFANAVPASATLNINAKGAKSIYYKGSVITAGIIQAGDLALFQYSAHNSSASGCYELLSIDRCACESSGGGGGGSEVSGLDDGTNWIELTIDGTTNGIPVLPAGLDDTIANSHTHTNKTTLDLIPTTNPLATLSYTVVREW